MKKENNNITSLDLYYILFGYVVGIGIWALPKSQVSICYQDGWIATLLGAMYPLVIVVLSFYIIDKFPNENILNLSEKFLGKIIGKILNFVFFTFFLIIGVMIISGFNNVMRVYGISFLMPIKIIGISAIFGGLASYKGLKVLAKINKVVFYILMLMMLLTVPALRKGTYLNLQPVLENSMSSILKGSLDTFYSYSGLEVLLLISTNVLDKKNIKKKAFMVIISIALIYTYAVVITIYYSGSETVLKSLWPLVKVSENIKTSAINNVRFVFSSTWIIIVLKSFANYYFACATIMEQLFQKMNKDYIYIILYFIFLYLAMKFTDEVYRRYFIDLMSLYYTSFNFLFILIISIFVFFKTHKNK